MKIQNFFKATLVAFLLMNLGTIATAQEKKIESSQDGLKFYLFRVNGYTNGRKGNVGEIAFGTKSFSAGLIGNADLSIKDIRARLGLGAHVGDAIKAGVGIELDKTKLAVGANAKVLADIDAGVALDVGDLSATVGAGCDLLGTRVCVGVSLSDAYIGVPIEILGLRIPLEIPGKKIFQAIFGKSKEQKEKEKREAEEKALRDAISKDVQSEVTAQTGWVLGPFGIRGGATSSKDAEHEEFSMDRIRSIFGEIQMVAGIYEEINLHEFATKTGLKVMGVHLVTVDLNGKRTVTQALVFMRDALIEAGTAIVGLGTGLVEMGIATKDLPSEVMGMITGPKVEEYFVEKQKEETKAFDKRVQEKYGPRNLNAPREALLPLDPEMLGDPMFRRMP